MEMATRDGRWIPLGGVTAVLTNRPRVLGVGGLLGIDLLAGFRRLEYELGPPDTLVLERE